MPRMKNTSPSPKKAQPLEASKRRRSSRQRSSRGAEPQPEPEPEVVPSSPSPTRGAAGSSPKRSSRRSRGSRASMPLVESSSDANNIDKETREEGHDSSSNEEEKKEEELATMDAGEQEPVLSSPQRSTRKRRSRSRRSRAGDHPTPPHTPSQNAMPLATPDRPVSSQQDPMVEPSPPHTPSSAQVETKASANSDADQDENAEQDALAPEDKEEEEPLPKLSTSRKRRSKRGRDTPEPQDNNARSPRRRTNTNTKDTQARRSLRKGQLKNDEDYNYDDHDADPQSQRVKEDKVEEEEDEEEETKRYSLQEGQEYEAEEQVENDENTPPNEEPPPSSSKKKKKRKRHLDQPQPQAHQDQNQDQNQNEPPQLLKKSINLPGQSAEAGIIKRITVSNFMCHRKLTVTLCRNVNFIYGQNGSGKSAILAAVQICLGAGARRTHRARNLRDLIRKGSPPHVGAKVRVTLWNCGEDAYKPDVYGEEICVERCIAPVTGGQHGYRLYAQDGREVSRSKKDLDRMLDELNIQVDNPVAVLDQEEAKKFLCGKPEDKYNLYTKATELERMDHHYATVSDNIKDMNEAGDKLRGSLEPAAATVAALKKEYDEFQQLEKLEEDIGVCRVQYVWSRAHKVHQEVVREETLMTEMQEKRNKRQADLDAAQEAADSSKDGSTQLEEQLEQLTEEANAATSTKKGLEQDMTDAVAPQRQFERQWVQKKREIKVAMHAQAAAQKRLQDAREQIMELAAAASNNEDKRKREEARRAAKIAELETELLEVQSGLKEKKTAVTKYLKEYEDLEPVVDQAKSEEHAVEAQFHAVTKRLRELEQSSENHNSPAMFGSRCVAMHQKVERAKAAGRFQGPVLGPLGQYIKIAPGKEKFAKLAERALGGGVLDRFVVTCDADRRVYLTLRKEAGCNSRECGVFQMSHTAESRRYDVPPPPCEGVETVASALQIGDDLVFNTLVDNCQMDLIALANSREESEEALLVVGRDGRESIRGGKIGQVYFSPNADHWQVRNGYRTMISNDNPHRLKQSIGVDRTAAIEATNQERQALRQDVEERRRKHREVVDKAKTAKIGWNEQNRAMKKAVDRVEKIQVEISNLKEEAAEAAASGEGGVSIDTTELEDDVKEAEDHVQELKNQESALRSSIDEGKPAIQKLKKELEEVTARNEKVLADMEKVQAEMEKIVREASQRRSAICRKKDRLEKVDDAIRRQTQIIEQKKEEEEEAVHKARIMTLGQKRDKEQRQSLGGSTEGGENGCASGSPTAAEEFTKEELEAIEPVEADREPSYYKAKIERAEKLVQNERRKRQISESDPAVAYEKWQRAKRDLDSRLEQIDTINDNIQLLLRDLKARRKLWRQFRSHLADQTCYLFDNYLQKKGSSGTIQFDHNDGCLHLVVQKDNKNDNSQTNDVKSLSGGERSYTTLALLLALGENLETPFRVMDEFDVFMDVVSRKIALDQMIQVAKELEHRQFIFITPQDLSSLKPDPMLKILKMEPPDRGGSQQTLEFSPSASQEE